AGAVLGVRRELVGVGGDVRHLTAGRADLGQRALGRAVAVGGAGVDDPAALLVRGHTPVLAGPAAGGPGHCAPGEAVMVIVGRAGRGVAAQVVRVPHGLADPRVTRVRVGARVEVLERGAAHAGHPRLRGRVVDFDASGAVGADAVEGAGVAGGREQALPLRGHLPEDDVLGLGVTGGDVVLADTPAGADRVGHVGLGDRGVLVEPGLAGEVVRRVVDD